MYLSKQEFDLIVESREIIKNNIDTDPLKLALKGVNSTICSQIKYLKRCKEKLPEYYSNFAIIPPTSYEQCSSSLSVLSRDYSGERCLDMTCGLGVDSYHFSKSFKKVITIERDEVLFEVAKHNFKLLDANNIEVVNDDSTNYIQNYCGETLDMIFIDPARRDSKDRFFSFEKSSPNVIELLEQLKRFAKRVVIKSSPLFDNKEALRLFGENCTLKTVSVGGECKELIIDINSIDTPKEIAYIINKHGVTTQFEFPHSTLPQQKRDGDLSIYQYKYALLPDVAIVKNRRVVDVIESIIGSDNDWCANSTMALSNRVVENNGIRCYEIIKSMPYNPKQILAHIKSVGIKKATLITKDFPVSIQKLKSTLKLNDGADGTIIFTTINREKITIFVK